MKTKRQSKQTSENSPEYDSAWKDVIEELFELFLEFLFPEIHRDIDFSRGCEFLSSELRKIIPDSKIGKRYADEVIKVWLMNGSKACICIYIHIKTKK